MIAVRVIHPMVAQTYDTYFAHDPFNHLCRWGKTTYDTHDKMARLTGESLQPLLAASAKHRDSSDSAAVPNEVLLVHRS